MRTATSYGERIDTKALLRSLGKRETQAKWAGRGSRKINERFVTETWKGDEWLPKEPLIDGA